jgi:GrpB-like predicted nucleotidyltransferase (UPF0157 family)
MRHCQPAAGDRIHYGQGMAVRQDPIELVPYDAAWPASFELQREQVADALAPWLIGSVEHIGSTSVPGLAAKPIIDMLARVADYDAGDLVAAMQTIHWVRAPEPDDRESRKWSFCFPSTAWRTHHLHVVEDRSPGWPTWIAFRDHLRTHPADAAEYARIKLTLAAVDDRDRPAYRAGKAPFIEEIVRILRCS